MIWVAGGESSVSYPETYPADTPNGGKRKPLSDQFQLVARLLLEVSKTKVFMVRIGGFDTMPIKQPTDPPWVFIFADVSYLSYDEEKHSGWS